VSWIPNPITAHKIAADSNRIQAVSNELLANQDNCKIKSLSIKQADVRGSKICPNLDTSLVEALSQSRE
jgi:hypothetical protein